LLASPPVDEAASEDVGGPAGETTGGVKVAGVPLRLVLEADFPAGFDEIDERVVVLVPGEVSPAGLLENASAEGLDVIDIEQLPRSAEQAHSA
jgi:hypothetical protein